MKYFQLKDMRNNGLPLVYRDIPQATSIELHRHDYIELVFVHGGNGVHLLQGRDGLLSTSIIKGGYSVLAPLAQPMVKVSGSVANVTFLMNTSANAYAKPEGMALTTSIQDDDDPLGPFYVGAVSKTAGRLFWVTSGLLLDETIDNAVAGTNGNLLLNTLNWMCGQDEAVSIRSKSLREGGIYVSAANYTMWSIILIGVIPLACIGLGVFCWIRRKRR